MIISFVLIFSGCSRRLSSSHDAPRVVKQRIDELNVGAREGCLSEMLVS